MSIEDPIPSPNRTTSSPHSSQPRLTGFSGLRSRMTGSSGSTDDRRHQRNQDDPGGSSGAGWQGAKKFIGKLNRKRTNRNTKLDSPK